MALQILNAIPVLILVVLMALNAFLVLLDAISALILVQLGAHYVMIAIFSIGKTVVFLPANFSQFMMVW